MFLSSWSRVFCADDDAGDGRMTQREADGGGSQRDIVIVAHAAECLNLGHDLGRGVGVVELAAAADRGGQDAGIVDTGETTRAMPRCLRERQEVLGGVAVQQRVASGEHGAVEVGLLERVADGLPFVDAEAEAADAACGFQLLQRAEAAALREGRPVVVVQLAMRPRGRYRGCRGDRACGDPGAAGCRRSCAEWRRSCSRRLRGTAGRCGSRGRAGSSVARAAMCDRGARWS